MNSGSHCHACGRPLPPRLILTIPLKETEKVGTGAVLFRIHKCNECGQPTYAEPVDESVEAEGALLVEVPAELRSHATRAMTIRAVAEDFPQFLFGLDPRYKLDVMTAPPSPPYPREI